MINEDKVFRRITIYNLTRVAANSLGMEYDELYAEALSEVLKRKNDLTVDEIISENIDFHDEYARFIRKKLAENNIFYFFNLN